MEVTYRQGWRCSREYESAVVVIEAFGENVIDETLTDFMNDLERELGRLAPVDLER